MQGQEQQETAGEEHSRAQRKSMQGRNTAKNGTACRVRSQGTQGSSENQAKTFVFLFLQSLVIKYLKTTVLYVVMQTCNPSILAFRSWKEEDQGVQGPAWIT